MKARPLGDYRKPALIGAAVGFFALVAAGLAFRFLVPDLSTQARADSADQAGALTAAKAAVETHFPTADSISFGKIAVNWVGQDPAVCGLADVDEEQDSFDGPERFIYFQGQTLIEEVDGSDALDARWKDLCEGY